MKLINTKTRRFNPLLFVAVILCMAISLSACSSEPTPTQPEVSSPERPDVPSGTLPTNPAKVSVTDYYPLKEGNFWQYEGTGNEYASYQQLVTQQSENKFQFVTDNSGTRTVNRYEVTVDSIIHSYREHEVYDDKSILDLTPNLNGIILKLPFQLGNSWVSEGNSCEIIDTTASVQVPAGIFSDCVVVRITYKDSGNSSILYFGKGIGLVKSEYFITGHNSIVSKLSEYDLK